MPALNITRSIVIDSTPAQVFEALKTMKTWPIWSPWIIAEPDCPVTYGADGKSYAWDGQFIGSGSMTLVDEKKDESLVFDLQFIKPWKSQAKVNFDLKAVDGGTNVVWRMDSSLPFFMFFMKGMMEAMVGMDYQRGLEMLKDLLETGSVPVDLTFDVATVGPFAVLGKKRECSVEEMPSLMAGDAKTVADWPEKADADPAGKIMTIYHKWDPVKGRVSYTIGIPVAVVRGQLPQDAVTEEIETINTATAKLTGPYRHLANAWAAGMMRGRGGAFKQSKKQPPFEIYENTPGEVPDNELLTTVHFPVKG